MGTGTPRREFLYVDDLADACVHLMKTYSSDELAGLSHRRGHHDRRICPPGRRRRRLHRRDQLLDPSRLDGTPRKLLDISRLAKLGWRATTPLGEGIKLAIRRI